jgi:hypothetical protein
MLFQPDLFENDQVTLLRMEVQKYKEIAENVRRGVFARINELERMILELTNKDKFDTHLSRGDNHGEKK